MKNLGIKGKFFFLSQGGSFSAGFKNNNYFNGLWILFRLALDLLQLTVLALKIFWILNDGELDRL